MTAEESYFIRKSPHTYEPTHHVSGGWKTDEQHIAPSVGLLAHTIEEDHKSRGGDLILSSLHYDILGVLPMEEVTTSTRVLRAGRSIELAEATLSHNDRPALILRAWLLKEYETNDISGVSLPRIADPLDTPALDFSKKWPGGFISSLETRQIETSPGRAQTWAKSPISLLRSEKVSDYAEMIKLMDIANGTTPRVDPEKVYFPNLDLNMNFFREPVWGWLGYDTSVSFGPSGFGLTHTILHDEKGPFGALSQTLTLRERS